MRTRTRALGRGVVLVMVLVAACAGPGPAAAPAPTPSGGTAATAVPAAASVGSSPSAAAAAPLAPAPRESLTFSIPSRNLNYIVPLAALALGFFDEAGLDLQIEAIAPNLTVAAMQRGDVKLTGTGGSAIRAVVRGGAPFTLVAFMTGRPTYFVVAAPEVRSAAQLAGRRVGVASLGDTPSLFTEIWLRQRGVDPGEVLFSGLGPNPALQISALQAGALDASVLDPGAAAVAEAAGFPVLQALGESVVGPQQGIVATNDLLQSSPATVRAFLKGLVRGLRYAPDHVSEVAAIARRELGIDMDESTAVRAVQFYVDGISRQAPGYADATQLEAFYENDVRLAMELPADQPIPALHDFRYLLAVYDELGIPRPR